MHLDEVVYTLGIKAEDKVIVRETAEVLWRDMERAPELVALLQDDAFASRLNQHLQCFIVRRIETPEFVDASYDEIGKMIATLRGRGESHVLYRIGGFPGVDHQRTTDDLDAALQAVGWRALSDSEMRALYLAPNLVRC